MRVIQEEFLLTSEELLLLLAGVGCMKLDGFVLAPDKMPDRVRILYDTQALIRKGMVCIADSGCALSITQELRRCLLCMRNALLLLQIDAKDAEPLCGYYDGESAWVFLRPQATMENGWSLYTIANDDLVVHLRMCGCLPPQSDIGLQAMQERLGAYRKRRSYMQEELQGLGEVMAEISATRLSTKTQNTLRIHRNALAYEIVREEKSSWVIEPYTDKRIMDFIEMMIKEAKTLDHD